MNSQTPSKKIIGVLGSRESLSSNHVNLGRVLSEHFHLDLLANVKQSEKILQNYTVRSYTSLEANGELSWFVRDLINIISYCFKEDADILLALQRPVTQAALVVIFGKLFRKKTVVRYAGDSFDTYKMRKGFFSKIFSYFLYKWWMRIMFFADKIICMGESQKQEMLAHGCLDHKISILLQLTDETIFHPAQKSQKEIRSSLGLPVDSTIILYVGALQKRKGIDTFLEIIPHLLEQREDLVFVIVGRDDQKYIPRLSKVGGKRIIFRASQSSERLLHEDLVAYYQSADLLLHPAFIEGFPRTVLEAAACGLPIVARDIVDIGRVADYTFKEGDDLVALLSKALDSLSPSRNSRLSVEFRSQMLSKRYLSLFESLSSRE